MSGMMRRNEVKWCSFNFFSKLIFILVSLQQSFGFDLFEEQKRQGGLIPAARLGRDTFLTTLDENKPFVGSMIASPRMGRRFWELHRTLIPYPRAGRFIIDPESLDYDILLNPDFGASGLEDSLTDSFLNNHVPLETKRSLKLVPRIGRKKRSIPEENGKKEEPKSNVGEKESKSARTRSFLNFLEDVDPDYFYRDEKKNARSTSAFVPRIGKKRSESDGDLVEEKRKAAFTPRVGRAALIPRIGRNDPRFRLMSRAALIPRIGRRAAFIPRVGRSDRQVQEDETPN